MTSACVVTSSAVVGSSARSNCGSVSSAAGDHDPLEHAAGQLVRVLPQPPLAVIDADLGKHVDGAPVGVSGRHRRFARIASVMKSPMRRTGFTCARGSWKIIATLVRNARRSAPASSLMSRPRYRISPRPARPGGSSRSIARAVIDLPEPDSPTSPTASPARTVSDTSRSTACWTPSTGSRTVRPQTSSSGAPAAPSADGSCPAGRPPAMPG